LYIDKKDETSVNSSIESQDAERPNVL